jgi:hypothetical protein
MNDFPDLDFALLRWYRRQRKWVQALVGLPICVALWGSAIYEALRHREPGEPQVAILWNLILLVAVVVLTELLRPKPQIEDARPALLGDFQFPTATEGRVVPILWGRNRVRGPNVVWYGDLTQEAISKFFKSGLWSGKRVITGFRYYLGVQFAICRGPNCVIRRIWVGEDEVWSGTAASDATRIDINLPELFGGTEYGQGGLVTSVYFYTGGSAQPVDAYLNTADRQRITTAATPTAPRYSGTCHLVARALEGVGQPYSQNSGAYLGTTTNIKPWSFEVERYPALFSGQSSGQNKIGGVDANPVNVMYELLTNTEWGFGYSPSSIDVGSSSSFKSASDRMIAEGNGWSLLLDSAIQAKELKQELERQMDAVVFLDQASGKWKIKLVRADYSIGSVLQLDESNVLEVRDFTRGSWEDTTNQIQVKYTKRDDDYKESYAVAQDQANAIISSGGSSLNPTAVVAQVSYPGVKNSDLASQIAWRDLRAQSYPLARVTLVVNRENWSVTIGDVVAWSSVNLGLTQLPMRVTRVDYGSLTDNQITLSLVQDVFYYATPSMGTPGSSGWVNPATSLGAYNSAHQIALEAPRAIITRDPDYEGDPNVAKVLCAARRQGFEVAFNIGQRNASGTPSGSFADAGDVVSFMRIGKLTSALSASQANPVSSFLITPDPDSQTQLEEAFNDNATLADLGVSFSNLILVGNEFMLVSDAAVSGADVALTNVYRGALDSAQAAHAINTPVYLIFVGAGLTETNFTNTFNVDIELRAKSSTATYSGSPSPTVINLTMAKRAMRPYPPAAALYNGLGTPFTVPSVDAAGSGLNGTGFNVAWWRRDYRNSNEVLALLSDDSGVDPSTEYRLRVFVDPSGSNTEVYTGSWVTGAGPLLVNRLLLWNVAAAGTPIRVQIEARHDILSEVDLTSRHNLIHNVTPTSAYDARFYLGGDLRASDVSNSYVALSTGTFTVRIGAAYSTSNVQVRINSGSWTTVIAAGGTSGTFSASSSDTIELRHTVNESPSPNLIQLEDPSAVIVAYGVLSD